MFTDDPVADAVTPAPAETEQAEEDTMRIKHWWQHYDRSPVALVDLAGDGRVQILFRGGVIFMTAMGLGVVAPLSVPSSICPC